jgi:hypothetical protein
MDDSNDEERQNIPGTAFNPILIEDQMTVRELIEAIARDTTSASTTATSFTATSSTATDTTTATAALVPLAIPSHFQFGNSLYQVTKITRMFALSPKNTIWYYPGTIIDKSDELYTIEYIDGDKRDKVPRKEILIPGEDEGIHEKLKEDQEVAVFILGEFPVGKVSHCNEDGIYNISCETKTPVTRDNVQRFEIMANKSVVNHVSKV